MNKNDRGEGVSDVMIEEEVCELLGIKRGQLRRLCRDKGFPFTRVGIGRVYLESEVIKWIRANQEPRGSQTSP